MAAASVFAAISTASDVAGIEKLYGGDGVEERPSSVARLVETSQLCVTAFNAADLSVVGFLSLGHYPDEEPEETEEGEESRLQRSEWAVAEAQTMGHVSPDILWVKALQLSHDSQGVVHAMLSKCFTLARSLTTIGWVAQTVGRVGKPSVPPIVPKAISSHLSLAARSDEVGALLYTCHRDDVIPKIRVRFAEERDFDDLLPLIHCTLVTSPALAQLPTADDAAALGETTALGDTTRTTATQPPGPPSEADALARLIATQDAHSKVLVAECERRRGKPGAVPRARPASNANPGRSADGPMIVGMVALSDDIDVAVLQESFELDTYDWLLDADAYDDVMERARGMVAKRADLLGDSDEEGGSEKDLAGGESAEQLAKARVARVMGSAAETDPSSFIKPIREDGETARVAAALEVLDPSSGILAEGDIPPHKAFAVTMLCVLPGWEHVGRALAAGAFKAYDALEHAVLTLPFGTVEPFALEAFTRVPLRAGMQFPEVLYICSRPAVTFDVSVRLAEDVDLPAIERLTEGLDNRDDLVAHVAESMRDSERAGSCMVGTANGEVVAVVTVEQALQLEALCERYKLRKLVDVSVHRPEGHAEIDVLVVNPLFLSHSRQIMSEVMRLTGTTCLYYAMALGEVPVDVLCELHQVLVRGDISSEERAPREHEAAPGDGGADPDVILEDSEEMREESSEDDDVGFSLYALPAKYIHHRRVPVNSRVVVVGASETGLAAVESLLCHRDFLFGHITVINPGGMPTPATEAGRRVGRIGMVGVATLLDATVVGIDRETRTVALSDGGEVAYDLLVLTPGVQDQTLARLDIAGDDRPPVITGIELSIGLTETVAQELALSTQAGLPVVVFGSSTAAYDAMQLLMGMGVPVNGLLHVTSTNKGLPSVIDESAEAAGMRTFRGVRRKTAQDHHLYVIGRVEEYSVDSVSVRLAEVDVRTGQAVHHETLECRLLVCCDKPEVDLDMVHAAEVAGLVFDGRIVVDGSFRTNDPAIYAAGPAAKFSQRYGGGLMMQNYHPGEIGQLVAEAIGKHFQKAVHAPYAALSDAGDAPNAAVTVAEPAPDHLPIMVHCRAVRCVLPGNMMFLYSGVPEAMALIDLHHPKGGFSLERYAEEGEHFLRVNLDAELRVHSLAYLGPRTKQAEMLRRLAGLPTSYLGDLFDRYAAGGVSDLLAELTQPWMSALYHDEFADLRRRLVEASALPLWAGTVDAAMSGPERKAHESKGRLRAIQACAAFLRSQATELPEYEF